MSELSGLHRWRPDTGSEIRKTARALLIEHGVQGVTLRAIARALGITAPALYRYYRSHSDLIEQVRADICGDLAGELTADIAAQPSDDVIAQFFAACRGFRRWALAHPREFTLVFAFRANADSGAAGDAALTTLDTATEPFGRVFISSAARLLAAHAITLPPDDLVPPELHGDISAFRDALLVLLAEAEAPIDADRLNLGMAYLMLQYWTRIYGHVALEVFGNFPIPVSKPDALFDSVLDGIAREVGLV
ncbi:MAG: TetR/AcrR family transcriptional regulator [Haloechinothrix sp.]